MNPITTTAAAHSDALFESVQFIWLGISLFFVILLLLTLIPAFKRVLLTRKHTTSDTLLCIIVFTVLSIVGTFWNVEASEGVVNFRAVGIMLGGFLGGPIVGTVTGAIAGAFRAFAVPGDTAMIHGGLSLVQGILAGYMSKRIRDNHPTWVWALFGAVILEILFWLAFIIVANPANPRDVMNHLAMPIIVTNVGGVVLFIAMLETSAGRLAANAAVDSLSAMNLVNFAAVALKGGVDKKSLQELADNLTSVLPELTWSAVVYGDECCVHTNFQGETEEAEGMAELVILQKQHELPELPHLLVQDIKIDGERKGQILVARRDATGAKDFKADERAFLVNLADVVACAEDYSQKKKA